jgi:hypothetical protein
VIQNSNGRRQKAEGRINSFAKARPQREREENSKSKKQKETVL